MLTDARIRAEAPGVTTKKLRDGGGLYLLVRPTGSKVWHYRYRIIGKENVFTIGYYYADKRAGHISLERARSLRADAAELVRRGVHPAHDKQSRKRSQEAENANTFEAVAEEWLAKQKLHWTPYYAKQVERGLKEDVYRDIGSMPITIVNASHIYGILQRVERRGAETVAINIRQWCSAVFRYAIRSCRADHDPALAVKGVVKRPRVQHHRPLSPNQIPRLLMQLDNSTTPATAAAVRLLLYTFVRPGELRAARWSEFDLQGAEWRIPAERMKMREQHVVPLPRQAVTILKRLRLITGKSTYLFPNVRRPHTVMTKTTINRALERMGFGGQFSSHGFRATASTILNEQGYPPDVIERQLAHKERSKSRAAYNQALYLKERRVMLQQWADFVDGLLVMERRKTSAAVCSH